MSIWTNVVNALSPSSREPYAKRLLDIAALSHAGEFTKVTMAATRLHAEMRVANAATPVRHADIEGWVLFYRLSGHYSLGEYSTFYAVLSSLSQFQLTQISMTDNLGFICSLMVEVAFRLGKNEMIIYWAERCLIERKKEGSAELFRAALQFVRRIVTLTAQADLVEQLHHMSVALEKARPALIVT